MSVRVLVVALGLAVLPAAPALASCEAPSLRVVPSAAEPGRTVTVSGRGWAAACHDTGQTEPAPPRTGIPLSLASAPEVLLGRVDAGADYTFTTQVVVPTGVPAGPTGLIVSVPATPSGTVHIAATPFDVVSTELPRTSAPLRGTGALAGLCLLLGAAALRVGRPPRAGTPTLRS